MAQSFDVFRKVHLSLSILVAVVFLRGEAIAGADTQDPLLPQPVITVETEEDGTAVAGEGYVLVSWEIEDPARKTGVYELEESRDRDFEVSRTRYTGRDRAVFVSGLPSGNTYFRVRMTTREAAGPWSEPLEVRADYPSRAWVGALLALGAVVFAFTIVAIVMGHLRSRREVDIIPE